MTACFQLLNCLFNCLLGTAELASSGPGEELWQVQFGSHACVSLSNEEKVMRADQLRQLEPIQCVRDDFFEKLPSRLSELIS
jgi:hypothetical protein